MDKFEKEIDEITEKYRKEMQEKINKAFNSIIYTLLAIGIVCVILSYFLSK